MTAQTVNGAVAVRDKETKLIGWLRDQQDDIAMAAASHIKPSAVIRVTQGALRRDPKLAIAAIANPQSLLYALLDAARLGHEPDTDDYYLVPFGNEVTGIEGYKGIIERMYRGGAVSSVVAEIVRKDDIYRRTSATTPPVHEFDEFADPDERGPLRGAYAYAVMLDGRYSKVIAMGRAEIMRHKAASRGSNRPDSPWQQWEESMWKKTVLRGLEPYVPTSTEYRTAPAALAARAAEIRHAASGEPRAAAPPADIAEGVIVPDEDAEPFHGGPAITPTQRRRLHAKFGELGFTEADREDRLKAIAALAGLPGLDSTNSLRQSEADAVLGKLRDVTSRDGLIALLAAASQDAAAEAGDDSA